MRNGYEIEKMWEDQGINLKNHLAFMCGSGWRAAEVYTYANVMGLKIHLYTVMDGLVGVMVEIHQLLESLQNSSWIK